MSIKTFTLRLTEEQLMFLSNKAKELGISKNDYIRLLIEGEVRADKQEQILKEIIEIKDILRKEGID